MNADSCPVIDKTLSAVLHIFILFGVLCLLFIIVISKLEKQAFNDEISSLMQTKVLPELVRHGSPALKQDLNLINFDSLKHFYSAPSPKLSINNKWLTTTMFLVNGFLFILAFSISILARGCLSFGHIILENVLVFSMIGVFEYLFFRRVASKYIPIVPSTFQRSLYTNLWK